MPEAGLWSWQGRERGRFAVQQAACIWACAADGARTNKLKAERPLRSLSRLILSVELLEDVLDDDRLHVLELWVPDQIMSDLAGHLLRRRERRRRARQTTTANARGATGVCECLPGKGLPTVRMCANVCKGKDGRPCSPSQQSSCIARQQKLPLRPPPPCHLSRREWVSAEQSGGTLDADTRESLAAGQSCLLPRGAQRTSVAGRPCNKKS